MTVLLFRLCILFIPLFLFTDYNFISHAIRIIYVNICLLTVCVRYFSLRYPYFDIFYDCCWYNILKDLKKFYSTGLILLGFIRISLTQGSKIC